MPHQDFIEEVKQINHRAYIGEITQQEQKELIAMISKQRIASRAADREFHKRTDWDLKSLAAGIVVEHG